MDACLNCGSKSSKDGHRCDHCGARVDQKLCKFCFHVNPNSVQFCMACGNKQIRLEDLNKEILQTNSLCPHCSHPSMNDIGAARFLEARPFDLEVENQRLKLFLHSCPHCGGFWVKLPILKAIIAMAHKYRPPKTLEEIKKNQRVRNLEEKPYFFCPHKDCGEMLGRIRWDAFMKSVNYQVVLPIIDSCQYGHGVWLDKGELEWLLESPYAPVARNTKDKEESRFEGMGYSSTTASIEDFAPVLDGGIDLGFEISDLVSAGIDLL